MIAVPLPLLRWLVGLLLVALLGGVIGWRCRAAIAERREAKLQAALAASKENLARQIDGRKALEEAMAAQNDELRALSAAFLAAERREREARRQARAILARPLPPPPPLTGQCEDMVRQVHAAAVREVRDGRP